MDVLRSMLTRGRRPESPRSRADLHEYWRRPPDAGNAAVSYATLTPDLEARSTHLVELVRTHAGLDPSILEIGCNAGRNLRFLHEAGYGRLSAIEISAHALDMFQKSFPDAYRAATLLNAPVEQAIPMMRDRSFDVVFTMAVLEHIHEDSAWVFEHIARVAGRTLITIEDEKQNGHRHFARRYDRIFQPFGFREVTRRANPPGLGRAFVTRVFRRAAG